jgi:hypothetical protein
MSSKVHNPATTKIIWTENKREHKAKVSVISRSKSRTDGFPLQMVGYVSYLPVTHFGSHFARNFDLLVPCVTSCAFARVSLWHCADPEAPLRVALWQIHLIRRHPLPFSHDLHRGSLLTGQRYLGHSELASCPLTILPQRPLPLTGQGIALMGLRLLMLTSATLLQSPES